MSTTVEEVVALANVEQCLEDIGVDSTSGHCHNACVWLAIQIKKANLSDYNIFIAVGTFWANDHSWLMIEDTETAEYTIVDMTVNQFVNREVPFSGPITDEYEIFDSVSLIDDNKLFEFVEKLGYAII